MNNTETVRLSKRLSRCLRHAPEQVGLVLDPAGWAEVADVLNALRVTKADLDHVVATNNKQRFAYDETGTRIRASQGHTIAVDLGLPRADPPAVLYHGTVARFLPAIAREGLRPMARNHVHLSATRETALTVGARRGKPVVLRVDTATGHPFWLSANGVWLTDHVPPEFLSDETGNGLVSSRPAPGSARSS